MDLFYGDFDFVAAAQKLLHHQSKSVLDFEISQPLFDSVFWHLDFFSINDLKQNIKIIKVLQELTKTFNPLFKIFFWANGDCQWRFRMRNAQGRRTASTVQVS